MRLPVILKLAFDPPQTDPQPTNTPSKPNYGPLSTGLVRYELVKGFKNKNLVKGKPDGFDNFRGNVRTKLHINDDPSTGYTVSHKGGGKKHMELSAYDAFNLQGKRGVKPELDAQRDSAVANLQSRRDSAGRNARMVGGVLLGAGTVAGGIASALGKGTRNPKSIAMGAGMGALLSGVPAIMGYGATKSIGRSNARKGYFNEIPEIDARILHAITNSRAKTVSQDATKARHIVGKDYYPVVF